MELAGCIAPFFVFLLIDSFLLMWLTDSSAFSKCS